MCSGKGNKVIKTGLVSTEIILMINEQRIHLESEGKGLRLVHQKDWAMGYDSHRVS